MSNLFAPAVSYTGMKQQTGETGNISGCFSDSYINVGLYNKISQGGVLLFYIKCLDSCTACTIS